jgi:uncharacterized integral membrane protein (TIGR00698 family)
MAKKIKILLPGLSIISLIAFGAVVIQQTSLFSKILPLSSLIIAIIIGIIINNVVPISEKYDPGVSFAAKKVLRIAIVLLGFRLSISEVISAGPQALLVILLGSGVTLLFCIVSGRLMGLPIKRAILIGSGISICGASAVAAVDGVIQGKKEDTAFAIGIVTLVGTIYMIVYPLIYKFLHLSDLNFALWAGSSIHEVAQVAAASSSIADPVMEAFASTIKMIRVLFIIPVSLVLLFFRWDNGEVEVAKKKVSIPWFALMFFGVVLFNSLTLLPQKWVTCILLIEKWLMTAAMAGLGMGIVFVDLVKVGKKAFMLGIAGSLFISLMTALVIFLVV